MHLQSYYGVANKPMDANFYGELLTNAKTLDAAILCMIALAAVFSVLKDWLERDSV